MQMLAKGQRPCQGRFTPFTSARVQPTCRDTRCWGERRSANRASWALLERDSEVLNGSIDSGVVENSLDIVKEAPIESAEDLVSKAAPHARCGTGRRAAAHAPSRRRRGGRARAIHPHVVYKHKALIIFIEARPSQQPARHLVHRLCSAQLQQEHAQRQQTPAARRLRPPTHPLLPSFPDRSGAAPPSWAPTLRRSTAASPETCGALRRRSAGSASGRTTSRCGTAAGRRLKSALCTFDPGV